MFGQKSLFVSSAQTLKRTHGNRQERCMMQCVRILAPYRVMHRVINQSYRVMYRVTKRNVPCKCRHGDKSAIVTQLGSSGYRTLQAAATERRSWRGRMMMMMMMVMMVMCCVQLQLFVLRLTTGTMGYSVYGFFVITRNTVLMVIIYVMIGYDADVSTWWSLSRNEIEFPES